MRAVVYSVENGLTQLGVAPAGGLSLNSQLIRLVAHVRPQRGGDLYGLEAWAALSALFVILVLARVEDDIVG